MSIVVVVFKPVPRIIKHSIRLLGGNSVGRDHLLIYLIGCLEFVLHHLLPGTLFDDLAPEAVLNCAVEQGEVDAPLSIVLLGSVLLVPDAK